MFTSLNWPSTPRRLRFFDLILIITLASSVPANASDLIVTCEMKQTDQDGSQYTFQRHYEIVFEVSHADVYDNHGSGFRRVYNGPFLKADDSRIVITQTPDEYHEISRTTGDVYDKISGGSV